MFLGLSRAATACLVLSNDIHRFTEFPFQLGSLCCLLLLLEICLKTSLLWKSPHFPCKVIPGHVFLLFVCVQKTTLSFSVNSFSFECLSLSSHNTHRGTFAKIYISTYMNSSFFSKVNKWSPFSLYINLGTLLSFYSSLNLSSLTVHDWNYTKYPYSILHKLSSRSYTIELILHLPMEIFGLRCCTVMLAFLK